MGSYVTMAGVLAWPVTVLLIAFLFRSELRRVLHRVELVKYGEFEANFNKELLKAEADAEAARTAARQSRMHSPGGVIQESTRGQAAAASGDELEALYRLAILSPADAVLTSWRKLEPAIAQAHDRLTPALAAQVERLRSIAASVNAAPKARKALGPDQARRFLDLARDVLGQVGSWAHPSVSGGSVA